MAETESSGPQLNAPTGSDGPPDEEAQKKKRYNPSARRPRCRFCQDGIKRIDYKDLQNLQTLVSAQGKILSRRRSGNCSHHQRIAKRAIKQARYIGFLSYTEGQLRGPRGRW